MPTVVLEEEKNKIDVRNSCIYIFVFNDVAPNHYRTGHRVTIYSSHL